MKREGETPDGGTAKRGGGKAPRPEREIAKRAFIEGDDAVTIAGLAQRHGYNRKALQGVAAREGWTKLRGEHRRRVEVARTRAVVEAAALDAAEVDRQGLKLARRILARCERFLDAEGRKAKGKGPALRPGDLLALANAARASLAAAHAAVGAPEERAAEMEGLRSGGITWGDVMEQARRIDMDMVRAALAVRDRKDGPDGGDGEPAPPPPAAPEPQPPASPRRRSADPGAASLRIGARRTYT